MTGGDDSGAPPESEEAFESDGRRVLGVLARLAPSVPPEVAAPVAEGLLEMLLELVARPETSAALVGALHKLCFAKVGEDDRSAVPVPSVFERTRTFQRDRQKECLCGCRVCKMG